jgi:hypothetical protein
LHSGTPPAALNASPTPAPSAQPPQTQPPTAQPPVAQPPQAQTPSGLANAAPLGIGAGPPVGNALPPPISPAGVANFTEGTVLPKGQRNMWDCKKIHRLRLSTSPWITMQPSLACSGPLERCDCTSVFPRGIYGEGMDRAWMWLQDVHRFA